MKKLLLFTIVVFSAYTGIAQPTNIGFENWTQPFLTFYTPNGWANLNYLTPPLGSNPISLTRVTSPDVHGGTYAAKLKTVKLTSPPSGWALQDTIGFMATGVLNATPPYLFLGYQETQRPSTFNFWAKYNPNGADTASAYVLLLKRNGSVRDTIGAGYGIITGTVSTYTYYQVSVIYNATLTGNPDTAIIAFSSSGNNLPKENSELFIDDLSFGFTTGIKEVDGSETIRVFPNPAVKEVNFSFASTKPDNVAIMSAAGHYIGTYKVDNKMLRITTEKLAAGVYLYFVKDNSENIIDTGKFTVTH